MVNNNKPFQKESTEIIFNKSTVVYIRRVIERFSMDLFTVDYRDNKHFSRKFAYSFDGQNWSNPVSEEDFSIDSDFKDVFISVHFDCFNPNDNNEATTIYNQRNVDNTPSHFELLAIAYNGENFDLHDSDVVGYETYSQIINKYPKWNFYDRQQVTINRWLDTCEAISEMYGHTCIYFKTEPVESETIHTFANHVVRNVVAIKKLKINVPNNELPQDRSAYTDWDFMMQDEFIVHMLNRKFRQAFGDSKIPLSKDYLYLPITGKLYRVSSVQPKNGFMNKIGWWECYLSKYEEDECVVMSDEIKNAMITPNSTQEMIDGINFIEDEIGASDELYEDENLKNILSEIDSFNNERVLSADKINQATTDEKKEVTQWHTNKNVDSNWYVGLKETEKQREFVNKRMTIVSVNPDKNTYPVTMYQCSTVDKRVVGLSYDLKDYTSVNKTSTTFNKSMKLDFNFVLLNSFTGELFDFETENPTNTFLTIQQTRTKMEIVLHGESQEVFNINYKFEINEFYRISIEITPQQIAIKIFTVKDKEKSLAYQDLYIIKGLITPLIYTLGKTYLFGGNYLTNDIYLWINDKIILKDNCNPIMQLNKFGQ